MENSIVDIMAESIINYNMESVMDFAEVGLDNLLEESFLKEIPMVKTVVNLAKTGFAIREKYMLKKTLIFINQLNSNGLSEEVYNDYKEKLKSKDKVIYRELENVLIIIDRMIDSKKSIILANLYYNYISKKLTWNEFQELTIIVDNIFICDLPEMSNIYNKKELTMNEIINQTSFNRLKTQNLVMDINSKVRSENGHISIFYNSKDYTITSLGINFFELGIKNIK